MRGLAPGPDVPIIQLTRALRRASAMSLAAALLGVAIASPVAAATALSNPSVTPAAGTTASVFTFAVHVVASNPVAVTAEVGDGTTVQLAVVSGSALNGTYAGSASLPAGTWAVTFLANGPGGGSNDDSIDLSTPITVLQGGTPPPTPTPMPTPTPTPTPAPTPTSTATAGATSTARPTASPTAPGTPGPTPTPAPGSTPQPPGPSASASAGGDTPTPGGTASTPGPSASVGASAEASASIAPAPTAATGGLGPLPWVVLGSTMAVAGAAVLGVQLARRRVRIRAG